MHAGQEMCVEFLQRTVVPKLYEAVTSSRSPAGGRTPKPAIIDDWKTPVTCEGYIIA
jgi:hypothetical protein